MVVCNASIPQESLSPWAGGTFPGWWYKAHSLRDRSCLSEGQEMGDVVCAEAGSPSRGRAADGSASGRGRGAHPSPPCEMGTKAFQNPSCSNATPAMAYRRCPTERHFPEVWKECHHQISLKTLHRMTPFWRCLNAC